VFEREDWTLFRNLGTLCQKAGVPLARLRRLVVKELVDNALDVCGGAWIEKAGDHTYSVRDCGPGIDGGAEAIARLFSVRRPLTSTKILRLPARGALGNGLRVVVGAVLASGGSLEVTTRGQTYKLQPQDNGSTLVVGQEAAKESGTTTIVVTLGDSIPADSNDLLWGRQAKEFAFAATYKGRTSPWWYDSDSFHELMVAAGDRHVSDLVEMFDGFGDGKGETPAVAVFGDAATVAMCGWLDRAASEGLLGRMREKAKPIPPKKIGLAGKKFVNSAYRKVDGVLEVRPGRGSVSAELPFVVEAWAFPNDGDDRIEGYVNGTPVTGRLEIDRRKANDVAVFGCGLSHMINGVSRKKFTLVLNVTTPYMPITTDGKEPDFSRYISAITEVTTKATRGLKGALKKGSVDQSQAAVIANCLKEAIGKASGGGTYRYSLRQLFYAVRPYVLESDLENTELDYNHFCRVVTAIEADKGDLPGMYRDPRGNLYHPHTGENIPIGTLAVEEYKRPAWTFNKILYCEKEGLVHLLRSVKWPERNDCALLSSKGFASRAVRDVLDLLGETGEEIQFFCIHDADASGTLIYQALQEATTARAARSVKIINLGLDPWEAVQADLQIEHFLQKSGRKLPVAKYVQDYRGGRPPEGGGWERWLQGKRVELNAMTSPQFIRWLDAKMKPYTTGKVLPPAKVLTEALWEEAEQVVRCQVMAEILDAGGFEGKVDRMMAKQEQRLAGLDVAGLVGQRLEGTEYIWRQPLREIAAEAVDTLS
jgi:hypothetical protein